MDDYGGLRTRRWEFDSLRTGHWGIGVIGNAVDLHSTVSSSNLLFSTKVLNADLAHLVEQAPCKRQVVGSSPAIGTSFIAG